MKEEIANVNRNFPKSEIEDKYLTNIGEASVREIHVTEYLLLKSCHHKQIKPLHQIHTNDIDSAFSKIFTEYIYIEYTTSKFTRSK